jgi:uncharacterized membrane protein
MRTDTATQRRETGSTAGVPSGPGLEIWISYVLRIGVLISAAIILIGLALLILRDPSTGGGTSLHQVVAKEQQVTVRPSTIARGVAAGDAVSIIQVGIFALILTPVTRVAMTVILFAIEREKIFVLVTLTVFLILLFGLTGLGT